MIEFIEGLAQEIATGFAVDLWIGYFLLAVIGIFLIIALLWLFKQLLILAGWFDK